MKVHELKTWPEYFEAVRIGKKTFEVRTNDRDFQVDDIMVLKEYRPLMDEFTGREVLATITYILHGGNFGILAGTCVIGFKINNIKL